MSDMYYWGLSSDNLRSTGSLHGLIVIEESRIWEFVRWYHAFDCCLQGCRAELSLDIESPIDWVLVLAKDITH